jgi:hypothetical protein
LGFDSQGILYCDELCRDLPAAVAAKLETPRMVGALQAWAGWKTMAGLDRFVFEDGAAQDTPGRLGCFEFNRGCGFIEA